MKYLAFSCGLLRGALTNLGHNCLVTAEANQLPICRFQINLQSIQGTSKQASPMMNTSISSQQISSLNTSMASMSMIASPTQSSVSIITKK